MQQTTTETLDRLLRRPWSRELVPDGESIAARIPELPGCFASGSTFEEALAHLEESLRSWLEVALETGAPIPEAQGEQEIREHSGRFSVRIPRSLHGKVVDRAAAEGCSLNQLVTAILAEAVGSDGSTTQSASTDAYEDITADAIAGGIDSIGAVKGIATFLRNRGDVNLACLVFAYGAERIAAGPGGAQEAAKELGTAGSLARRERRVRLAEALWRESLRRDLTNIRSRSSLGQLLHHQGRYEEAAEYLEPVADLDDYARMFLGWSRLQLGLATVPVDDELASKGLADVIAALRRWCAYGAKAERSSWLRQVRRLYLLGPRFRGEVEQLISFANSNANWPKMSLSEIENVSRAEDEDLDVSPDANRVDLR